MNDEQLEARLRDWGQGQATGAPVCSSDMASLVRARRSRRTRHRRVMVAVSTALSLILVGAAIGVRFGMTPDSRSTALVGDAPAEHPDGENAEAMEQTRALEQLQLELDRLAMYVRVQQEIAESRRLMRDIDRLQGQETQASQWLLAALQETAASPRQK